MGGPLLNGRKPQELKFAERRTPVRVDTKGWLTMCHTRRSSFQTGVSLVGANHNDPSRPSATGSPRRYLVARYFAAVVACSGARALVAIPAWPPRKGPPALCVAWATVLRDAYVRQEGAQY